jgi:dTMP kinase
VCVKTPSADGVLDRTDFSIDAGSVSGHRRPLRLNLGLLDTTGHARGDAIDLIRRGPFARLWWSSAISSLGDWITFFASLALADSIGGKSGVLVPLISRLIPGLLFGALAGVLADRMDRKRTMVISDFGRGVLVLALLFVAPIAQSNGAGVGLWALATINFMLELLTLIRQPAREAALPTLVDAHQLVGANSLSLAAAYGTGPLGSAMYAMLAAAYERAGGIGVFDTAEGLAFGVDSVTFVVSGIIVATIAIPAPELVAEAEEADRPRSGFRIDFKQPLRDLWDGVRFVAGVESVRNVVLGMATALFGGGALIALGQSFSRDVLGGGASGFGILVTALGIGVGVGMLAVSVFAAELSRRDLAFAVSLTFTGLGIVFAALAATVWGASGWVFVTGVTIGFAYVMGFTHLHETVDDTLRGRTFAALFTLVRTAFLVSVTLAVAVAAALDNRFPSPFDNGIRNVLVLGGVIIMASGLGTLWAMRTTLRRPSLNAELYQSWRDASDTFNTIRGKSSESDE